MRFSETFKNLDPTPRVREYTLRRTEKLRRLTKHFRADSVHLQLTLELQPKKAQHSTALALHLPSQTLTAREQARDELSSLKLAFDTLERQLEGFKSRRRREASYRQGRAGGTRPRGASGALS
ncbi:MAG: ribosome-associated translation inhibitor RaiA [Deltaproteobacteria bacterium]|nr:ribosome-associated translation inhibitor RaiA [Deltaproteobacteria bacterium]MBI3079241.1 ribosome-associated translation inhibitor RaiA [Deltaproteobacteria bacterium]